MNPQHPKIVPNCYNDLQFYGRMRGIGLSYDPASVCEADWRWACVEAGVDSTKYGCLQCTTAVNCQIDAFLIGRDYRS